jgi:hypothetical protein
MRNLQYFLFLSLFGLSLTTGCTITTSDTVAKGGDGGGSSEEGGNSAKGGTSAQGGSSSHGGTSSTVGGATSTPFTAADCTAAAATVPATVPDVTPACIACLYGTGCTEAVACENTATCMPQVRSVLECVRLYFRYSDDTALPEFVEACQDGSLTAPPAQSDSVAVVSQDPGAWLGASISTDQGRAVVQVLAFDCAIACNFSN